MTETQLLELKLFVNNKRQSETVIPTATPPDNAKSGAAPQRVENKPTTNEPASRAVAPKSSVEASSHTGPTDSTNTAPQAASKIDTPLLHLNNCANGLSKWDVSVTLAHTEDYEYTWDGKPRKRASLPLLSYLCIGPHQVLFGRGTQRKGRPTQRLGHCSGHMQRWTAFRISRVEFTNKSKTEYNSCTHKVCVNLNKNNYLCSHAMQPEGFAFTHRNLRWLRGLHKFPMLRYHQLGAFRFRGTDSWKRTLCQRCLTCRWLTDERCGSTRLASTGRYFC